MMTEPPPRRTRCGAPTMTVFQTPVTLMSRVFWNCSGVTESHAVGVQMPALATTTSSPPSSATAASTWLRMPSRSRTSA